METVLLVQLALLVLAIAIVLFKYLVVGAGSLFRWASEQGFIGAAVYFACWIFLFPFYASCVRDCWGYGFAIRLTKTHNNLVRSSSTAMLPMLISSA